jgi:A/G-specific adenine glycosylase
MLQQTQVDRVIPKYRAFLRQFPSLPALARTTPRDVVLAWAGMGYNRRALYLHRLARIVVDQYHGKLPLEPEVLRTLPGIGPYTAAAVATFATATPHALADVNIRRVLGRVFYGIPDHRSVSASRLLDLVERTMPQTRVSGIEPSMWGHALMDLGALVCKATPKCEACPLKAVCKAYPKFERAASRIQRAETKPLHAARSKLHAHPVPDRILRGSILAATREEDPAPVHVDTLQLRISRSRKEVRRLIQSLVHDGLLEWAGEAKVQIVRGS